MDTMIDRKSERYKVARELLRAERSPLEKAKALKILKDIQDSQMLLIGHRHRGHHGHTTGHLQA